MTSNTASARTGRRSPAAALAAGVARRGAPAVFGVPGGGANLELIAECERAGLRFVLAHGEAAACIMASTFGLLTGRPALALATRGPGATSAVNGAAQATLDRFPLILATDTVAEADADRIAHQRLDQVGMLDPVTKWSGVLGREEPDTVVDSALRLAAAAPAGAVHLALDASAAGSALPPGPSEQSVTDPRSLHAASDLVANARRPVVIVGFGALQFAADVRRLLRSTGWPVLQTYQANGVVARDDASYAGLFTNGALERDLLTDADVILAIGLDPVEPIPAPWPYAASVITIATAEHPERYLPATVELAGPVAPILLALAAVARRREPLDRVAPSGAPERSDDCARGEFGPVELVDALLARLPARCVTTVDAGAHFLAIMPRWPVREPLSLLISNGLATMGFAVPAAIGAALARPDRPVLALVGDGGLGMSLAELETIARLDLPITVAVFNDATLSLIDLKRTPATVGSGAVTYSQSEFAKIARGLGINSTATVSSTAELVRVLSDGWDRPRLVDARIDPHGYRELFRLQRG